MAQQEQTNITYEEYVLPYKDKFILVNIPQERIDNIIKLTESLIKLMDYEQQHKIDTKELYNKIYCNLLAEAACEIVLDIPIIDWISGDSVRFFNAPDIRQLNIGIIVCNYGEFPLINNRNRYHQIICLRNPDDTIYVCGLASRVTLNIYQSDDLLSFKSRKPKTYFYGFHALTSIKDINLSKVTNNAKSNTN